MKPLLVIAIICILCGHAGYRYGFRSESSKIEMETDSETTVPVSMVETPIDALPATPIEAGESDNGLSKEEVLRALEEAAHNRNARERRHLSRDLFARLAQLDRDAAFEKFLALEYGLDSNQAIAGFATSLAESDPADAFAFWLSAGKRLPENVHQFHDGMYYIFKVWNSRDPVAAVASLDSLEDDLYRMSAINGFFSTGDFENASHRDRMLALARSLTDDGDPLRAFRRRHAMGLVAKEYATGKSLQFMDDWLNQQDLATKDRSYLDWTVAETHLTENPHKAVNWLLQRSTEEALPSHLANIVNKWARTQPNACGEWLGSLQVGSAADHAMARFAEIVVKDDPESAIEWAGQITDETKRRSTLEALKKL